jgi:diguanylate cyclase (GGDEF)-like protein
LDGFAIINDGLGYKFGDSLLKSVVVRLESCIRSSDTVARLDGDRFALVLQVASADDGVKIAEKLVQAMKQPFIIDGREVGVTASIGISLYPADGENVDVLAKRAESAMRHAKKAGGGRYVFFANDMNMKAKMRIEMEGNLRRAIQQKEFLLYYQPKVDVETQQIIGMEALIRWNDPVKGIISPTVFIPVAEETGLIEQIGLWGLREACFQNKRWQDNGLQPVRVSVNISGRQFSSSDIINNIKEVLDASGLSSKYLELEITESLLMTNTEDNIQKLQQIREMGCHLSIDDFGTGYSSLSYLTRFPISTLKIDRAFIHDIETNKNTAEITLAIIGMSKGLKLEVVAEGAETIKHIDFLRKHGCKTAQGFYYSRPVPAEEFEKLLAIGFIKKD